MTSDSFQLFSDQQVLDMKRSQGILACAECQKRKIKCDKKFPCSSCVRRGRTGICPTGDVGFIGKGRRYRTPSVTRCAFSESSTTIPSAGDRIQPAEQLDSAIDDTVEDAPSQALSIHAYSWNITKLEILLGQLPDELRAWALYDIFVAEASWYCTPIMPDELHELLVFLYDPNSNIYELTPHALGVAFLCFASATFADLALPACSPQADTYFDLGRTALTLQPVFGSADLYTIQALVLAGLYYVTGGPHYNLHSWWTLHSMAITLCQTLNLHRETEHGRFENKIAERRRALFWEVFTLGTYQSLAFARPSPLTIPFADITCEFPADVEQTSDSEGHPVPGYFRTKYKFTKEVTAPMAQAYTSATPMTYDELLDLDRRLRQFMKPAPFAHYHNKPGEARTFLAYVRSNLIPRYAGNLMVYIHRGSFIQALQDRPLDGPYAASFLAAYHGASATIKSDLLSLSLYPDQFHRWWPIWKSLINASFIVASIVAKSPTAAMAPAAHSELLAAVELVERGAVHSFVAEGSLPMLYRLRNKATTVYAVYRPLHSPAQFDADDNDLGTLRSQAIVQDSISGFATDSLSSSSPALPCLEMGTVALSSLVPTLMPPPPLLLPSPQDPQMLDLWLSSFPLGSIVESAPASSSSVDEGGNRVDGLEAYLAAQLRPTLTSPSIFFAEGKAPADAEQASFLRLLE
ncbi:fungal-specific transcription factor domain-containing protein [Mycena vitilis]|nr:fungal-specific transcription factor domain-containing protein [Mycena vitilis]